MNIQRQFSILFLITVTVNLLITATNLVAGPIKVNSANPNSGVVGDPIRRVEIRGQGFTHANSVRFLVTKSSNEGGLVVSLNCVDNTCNDSTIYADVTIPSGATIADYDIEVQLMGGRKGKGTTLYSVSANSNQTPRPVTEVNNTAVYSGSISEIPTASTDTFDPLALPRNCEVEIIQSNNGIVHYECDPGGLISINFSDWYLVGGTGEKGYCDLLDTSKNLWKQEFREFTPTRYWYRNDGECVPGGMCEIRISQISFRGRTRGPGTDTGETHKYVGLGAYGLEDVGRISIRTWAQLDPLEDEGNVFTVPHNIVLQYIAVDFRAAGKNKTVATCRIDYPVGAQLNTTVP
jgi:hypothetical protein